MPSFRFPFFWQGDKDIAYIKFMHSSSMERQQRKKGDRYSPIPLFNADKAIIALKIGNVPLPLFGHIFFALLLSDHVGQNRLF